MSGFRWSIASCTIAALGILGCANGPSPQDLYGSNGNRGGSGAGGGGGADDTLTSTATSTSSGMGGAFSSSSETSSGTGPPPRTCDGQLTVTIRDFSSSHPDFEAAAFGGAEAFKGIVLPQLGNDKTPVYAHAGATSQTTGPTEFQQWYHDVPGVNQTFQVKLTLDETEPGVFVYDSGAFFPIDNLGFGNEGNPNNFHFTTEVHTSFIYKGGEQFTFAGDDDLWLFINGQLAIDLGGLHPKLSETILLDDLAASLGLKVGTTYPMDIFHAERHTVESNFRIETTIDCFQSPDPK